MKLKEVTRITTTQTTVCIERNELVFLRDLLGGLKPADIERATGIRSPGIHSKLYDDIRTVIHLSNS